MSEKNLRHAVRDALKPGFVLQVENAMQSGTPDTYVGLIEWRGWLELKYAREIPARATTGVFTSLNRGLEVAQEATLFKMWQHSPGSAWVYVRIEKDCYLVPGEQSYEFNAFTLSDFQKFSCALNFLRGRLVDYSFFSGTSIV